MKKADYILMVGILIFGLLFTIFYRRIFVADADASVVYVYVDNTLYESIPLENNGVYEIKSEDGNNQITIDNGQVYVSESDCDGRDCVKMGRISKSGETICCLPHKLIIKIKASDNSVDTVAY